MTNILISIKEGDIGSTFNKIGSGYSSFKGIIKDTI